MSDNELIDLIGFVNTIITHIINGNEERLVNITGGTIIEALGILLSATGYTIEEVLDYEEE